MNSQGLPIRVGADTFPYKTPFCTSATNQSRQYIGAANTKTIWDVIIGVACLDFHDSWWKHFLSKK
jgi:hypothetical protein